MADQPWHELPPEIAAVFRPVLADVADEMIDAVRTIPAYARPIDGAFGEGMRAGRSLESLLTAYRIGARVAWRRLAAVGVAAGLEPETLYLLAESIFAYI